GARRRGRTTVEIFVTRKLLPDQLGPDHLSVLLHKAALRLVREEHAGNTCYDEGIDEAGDDGQTKNQHDRRTDLFQHDSSPQTRCMALTKRSMALMPTNGMMRSPTP